MARLAQSADAAAAVSPMEWLFSATDQSLSGAGCSRSHGHGCLSEANRSADRRAESRRMAGVSVPSGKAGGPVLI